jgi:CelD/BcsL family acetyltransferase involved in cellulose biosynthesis
MNAIAGALAADPAAASPIDEAAASGDPRHAFLRAAWFAEAERTLIARRGDGSVSGALPLVRRAPFLQAVPGSYWPMRSFPLAPDADLKALLAGVPAPVLRIGPIRADDPTLLRLAGARGWTMLRRRIGTCYVFELGAAARAGEWPRGSTLKKNRWFEKQLAAEGPLRFETVRGAAWTGATFDLLAEIERKSWIASRTDARDAKFLAPHHRTFWEQAVRDPRLAEMISASVLFVGDRPAAFAFGLEAGTTYYLIANSYDEHFARHSPGRVLIHRDLERAMQAGIEEVDWGSGDAGYKKVTGGEPGPDILDCLLVRSRVLAAVLRPLWAR